MMKAITRSDRHGWNHRQAHASVGVAPEPDSQAKTTESLAVMMEAAKPRQVIA